MYMIANKTDPTVFWSVSRGWTDPQSADRFRPDERTKHSLPVGGYWIPMWSVDFIQFFRLIAEADMVGLFEPGEKLKAMCDSMDLSMDQVISIIDRAHICWELELEKLNVQEDQSHDD